MPIFTIRTPRGDEIDIDAPDEATAVRGAERWDYEDFAASEAKAAGLNPDLVLRQMDRESGARGSAVSPKGARGPMQLMPGTADELGVNIDDPYDNIRGGVRYLKQQFDAFGGDERLALAAYNAGPGAVQKHGGVPPYPETQAYVEALAGQDGGDWQEVGSSHNRGVTIELPSSVRAEQPAAPVEKPLEADNALGFSKGVVKPIDNAARGLEWLAGTVGLDKPINALGDALGMPSMKEVMADRRLALATAQKDGRRPGTLGEFAGNVVGTLPLGALRIGALGQGALSGGALSEAQDAKGVVRDMALGAAASKVAEKGLDVAGKGLQRVLTKAPKIPGLQDLQTAKRLAYAKVAGLGGAYTGKAKRDLLTNIESALLSDGLDQGANPGAWAALNRVKAVLSGKNPVSLSDLDNLRQSAYRQAAGLQGPDKAAERYYGNKIIEMIDDFVDNATPPQVAAGKADELAAAIKEARSANQRFRKFEAVANKLDSADLRSSAAYTGTNVDNTIRQQLRPLIDKTSGQRMRGLTPDEEAAIRRVVKGSPGQNIMRTAGQLSDPRKLLGMGLQAAGIAPTGGLSLATVPLGMAGTTIANLASQKNVERLLQLLAAGGSKQALARQATPASRVAQQAVAKVRPAASLAGAAAASQSGR
ncbi:lytic transglycosylase domain-containing protein [Phenylobacterium sp.]|uniref:lytic transglycosylase domain-containing protein n=1 Tax=Phenylobacterium sp. TaxID=1871053 RepID=UPI0035ADA102